MAKLPTRTAPPTPPAASEPTAPDAPESTPKETPETPEQATEPETLPEPAPIEQARARRSAARPSRAAKNAAKNNADSPAEPVDPADEEREQQPETDTATPAAPQPDSDPLAALALVLPGSPIDDTDETVNILYYGPEGTGKSTDLAFLANFGPVVVFNAEGGLKTRRLQQLGVDTANLRVWPDQARGETLTFDGMEALYWQLKDLLASNPKAIAGIAWDSITEIHKLLLDDIVRQQGEKAARGGKARDRFFIDRGDYGVMTEQVRLLVRRFRDLPCHFVATALEKRTEDENTRSVSYGPSLTAALADQLPGFFDIVVHTSVLNIGDDEVYTGQTRPGGGYRAKDRWGATPAFLAEPTFERVYAYVTEQLSADEDPIQAAARERLTKLREAEAAEAAAKAARKNAA